MHPCLFFGGHQLQHWPFLRFTWWVSVWEGTKQLAAGPWRNMHDTTSPDVLALLPISSCSSRWVHWGVVSTAPMMCTVVDHWLPLGMFCGGGWWLMAVKRAWLVMGGWPQWWTDGSQLLLQPAPFFFWAWMHLLKICFAIRFSKNPGNPHFKNPDGGQPLRFLIWVLLGFSLKEIMCVCEIWSITISYGANLKASGKDKFENWMEKRSGGPDSEMNWEKWERNKFTASEKRILTTWVFGQALLFGNYQMNLLNAGIVMWGVRPKPKTCTHA